MRQRRRRWGHHRASPEETTTTAETPEETTTTEGEMMDAPDSIRIGAVVPLTGPFAGGGAQIERGYIYAVDAINEAGGVFVEEYGQAIPLELDVRDDASDPNQTTSIMDELAGSDIVAYLGGFATPVHAAGSATAERNGIPYLGAATSTQALHEQGYQYFFSPFPKSPTWQGRSSRCSTG
jgi:ABC-type branched-subunit amino acid transport system substrate-binding protein